MKNNISVLIITYDRPKDLLDLLQNLAGQHGAADILCEVLVLDNASTISYKEVTDFIALHPELKIQFIKSDENLGVARGRNKLMTMAKGDWLLVVDDDVLFSTTDDLQKIAAYPQKEIFSNTNTAVFCMHVIYFDTREDQITAFPHKKYEQFHNKQNFLTYYYIGCAHLLKREVLEITGVYPSDFFYGMEEYDLGYRILNAGYTIAYDNEVTIMHKESPLGRQPNYKKLQMQWLNKSKVAWRYLPFIFFVSTAFMWSLQYLKNMKGKHLGSFFTTWAKVIAIPFMEKRKKLRQSTLQYLKRVESRLWY